MKPHGSAPVTRAERDVITRAAAIGVQPTAHASAAITRPACRIHRFPFFLSARPLPRLAPLADLIGSGVDGDRPRKEVRRMYRWEVPKILGRRLARVRDRTGVPVARQLRRAVDEYLDQHDAPVALRAARATPITATRGGSER